MIRDHIFRDRNNSALLDRVRLVVLEVGVELLELQRRLLVLRLDPRVVRHEGGQRRLLRRRPRGGARRRRDPDRGRRQVCGPGSIDKDPPQSFLKSTQNPKKTS